MGWGTGNLGGGSGGGLNFKVVGNPQPANPKENTIWLNTDVDITGKYFQAEQPEEMVEGEVWISTGTASNVAFNALKKSTIMVYPLSAKQYVSGAWVDVNAMSYQDGSWHNIKNEFIIYDSGSFGENPSGDIFDADCVDDGENVTSVSKQTSYMKWESVGDSTYALFYITPKISCAGFSTLKISLTNVSASLDEEGVRWGLARETNAQTPKFVAYEQVDSPSGNETISVDVSNVGSSSYYAALRASTPDTTGFTARVTKIWLE